MKSWVAGLFLMGAVVSCEKKQPNQKQDQVGVDHDEFYTSTQRCPLDSLLTQSKTQHKPVLLYFTAFAEVNCRKMEDHILSSPDVDELIQNQFIPMALYTDDKEPITPAYLSAFMPDSITNIGEENQELQRKFSTSAFQPQVVILRWDQTVVGEMGFTHSTDDFKNFLKKSLSDF